MPPPVIVLDNGASTIKVGLGPEPRIISNAVVRSKGDKMSYFGHEIARCEDYSSLHYRLPFEKGYLVDWDAQKAIWDGIFSDEVLGVDTTQSSLLITEPYFNLPNIQDIYDQLIFEEYEFSSYYRCSPASLIPYGQLFSQPGLPPPDCMIVVDSGFSFTHVIPMIDGKIVWNVVKRLDVGGKLLTNHLKELVSFRQWNMMDETYIMNHVKESCCFVSTNFQQDTETCRIDPKRNPIVQEYVLPDLSTNRKGRIRQPDDIITETDQILVMNNERFTVPELLFRPDDIGLDQAGLSSTIAHSISLLPTDLQGMFWANIGLIGGNTKFSGFRDRLTGRMRGGHIRMRGFAFILILLTRLRSPITEVYKSAYNFAMDDGFLSHVVTRAEYAESGSSASRRKFRDWRPQESEKEKVREAVPSKLKGKQQQHREDDRSQAPSKPTKTRSTRAGAGTGSASTAPRKR
uniref:Actin-like protein ARP6 n=1 Tax=Psilocybe cubensis TaxID=181762 RepID=A0A8H7XR10_PSICU